MKPNILLVKEPGGKWVTAQYSSPPVHLNKDRYPCYINTILSNLLFKLSQLKIYLLKGVINKYG